MLEAKVEETNELLKKLTNQVFPTIFASFESFEKRLSAIEKELDRIDKSRHTEESHLKNLLRSGNDTPVSIVLKEEVNELDEVENGFQTDPKDRDVKHEVEGLKHDLQEVKHLQKDALYKTFDTAKDDGKEQYSSEDIESELSDSDIEDRPFEYVEQASLARAAQWSAFETQTEFKDVRSWVKDLIRQHLVRTGAPPLSLRSLKLFGSIDGYHVKVEDVKWQNGAFEGKSYSRLQLNDILSKFHLSIDKNFDFIYAQLKISMDNLEHYSNIGYHLSLDFFSNLLKSQDFDFKFIVYPKEANLPATILYEENEELGLPSILEDISKGINIDHPDDVFMFEDYEIIYAERGNYDFEILSDTYRCLVNPIYPWPALQGNSNSDKAIFLMELFKFKYNYWVSDNFIANHLSSLEECKDFAEEYKFTTSDIYPGQWKIRFLLASFNLIGVEWNGRVGLGPIESVIYKRMNAKTGLELLKRGLYLKNVLYYLFIMVTRQYDGVLESYLRILIAFHREILLVLPFGKCFEKLVLTNQIILSFKKKNLFESRKEELLKYVIRLLDEFHKWEREKGSIFTDFYMAETFEKFAKRRDGKVFLTGELRDNYLKLWDDRVPKHKFCMIVCEILTFNPSESKLDLTYLNHVIARQQDIIRHFNLLPALIWIAVNELSYKYPTWDMSHIEKFILDIAVYFLTEPKVRNTLKEKFSYFLEEFNLLAYLNGNVDLWQMMINLMNTLIYEHLTSIETFCNDIEFVRQKDECPDSVFMIYDDRSRISKYGIASHGQAKNYQMYARI